MRDNIVRFGQQAYDDLPAFLACFDVALMPFARNEATRAISPTKTLEYLAGGKPVVSTPITDVITLYGDAVEIATTGEEFVAAAEAVLNRTSDADRQWRARAARLVAAHDWDCIAIGDAGGHVPREHADDRARGSDRRALGLNRRCSTS